MSSSGGNKAIIAALSANLGIALTKLIAYLLTGMSSMLAEAVHSFADSGNQLLLLVGGKKAKRSADVDHPFGYGRERYVYAFIVSIVLFTIGGLFALYEAYHKWHEAVSGHGERPGTDQRWWWVPLLVLVVAICMEGFSFRTAIGEANHTRGAASWVRYVRGAKAPELPVVLLEDFAALIGLLFAMFGVGLAIITQDARWDAAGTAMIGLLLVAVAVVLAVEMKSLLIGEGAAPERVRSIRDAIESVDVIDRVIHLKTLHLGPDELLVAAKVAVDTGDTGGEISAAIDAAETAARSAQPDMELLIYLEPALDTGEAGADSIGHVRSGSGS